MKHRAVIFFRVEDQPRVLFSEEILIARNATVTAGEVCSMTSHLQQLVDHRALTRLSDAKTRRVTRSWRVFASRSRVRPRANVTPASNITAKTRKLMVTRRVLA